jgi:two-component system alkaline phosphatase synthesis response regulator PhoP
MPKEHIHVVEDEEDILELIKYNLSKEGYQVSSSTSGEDAIRAVESRPPDLILLDLMLPGADGFEVCRRLGNNPVTREIPIVMLTAKGEESDIVTGLELGADDYITKPFSPKVLIARIRAVLRRVGAEPVEEGKTLTVNEIEIHPGKHEVLISGKKIDLTSSEFRLLYLLASRPGWVFTRYQIVDALHGEDYPVTDRSVDVQVVGLRKKWARRQNISKQCAGWDTALRSNNEAQTPFLAIISILYNYHLAFINSGNLVRILFLPDILHQSKQGRPDLTVAFNRRKVYIPDK